MKRTGGPPVSTGSKKFRDGEDDESGSQPVASQFEDELMMMDTFGDDDILDVVSDGIIDAAQEKLWARPEVENFDSAATDLKIHWLDIDMTSGVPLETNPCKGEKTVGSREAIVPVVRLYGSTSTGESVLAYIHGFTQYFYVALPPSTNLDQNTLGQLRIVLDQKVRLFFSPLFSHIFLFTVSFFHFPFSIFLFPYSFSLASV